MPSGVSVSAETDNSFQGSRCCIDNSDWCFLLSFLPPSFLTSFFPKFLSSSLFLSLPYLALLPVISLKFGTYLYPYPYSLSPSLAAARYPPWRLDCLQGSLGSVRKVDERRLDKAKIGEKAQFTGCK